MSDKTILVIGTFDTKNDELGFLGDIIREQGGRVLTMDVSVLGNPLRATDYSKHDVAAEGGSSIENAIDTGDENHAMQIMAAGAALLTSRLYSESRFDAMIVLGGTMGTDLALDVCSALPLGVPKYIVSTVSFSPLIPAWRLAADTQMILWAGGLYGLNSICRASLSQAAGAVLGSARAVIPPERKKPLIGMTSLGASALKYMVPLKPALEERGYEVAVFHATGMGGRAFESLARQGAFACVFDFCTQELGNHVNGSIISAGPDRLTGAGLNGTPQIVAPGCYDLVDIVGWHPLPGKWTAIPATNTTGCSPRSSLTARNAVMSPAPTPNGWPRRRVPSRCSCQYWVLENGIAREPTCTIGRDLSSSSRKSRQPCLRMWTCTVSTRISMTRCSPLPHSASSTIGARRV